MYGINDSSCEMEIKVYWLNYSGGVNYYCYCLFCTLGSCIITGQLEFMARVQCLLLFVCCLMTSGLSKDV